ncbi:MAG: hypothetical protein IH594_09575 [Bacteroidales bacterium]|nr:hypothetical protein [Bacteroidales bacterium]
MNTLAAEIENKLCREPFREWFSPEWFCRTESELIDFEGNILRPDRIMIRQGSAIILDFKFGFLKKASYQQQMKGYYRALKDAGYETVKLYIWYYNLDELEEVLP